jgi:Transposase DNA-binding
MSNQAEDLNWAVHEFADADLGDVRRTKRLVELAQVLAQHPTAALPAACGDGAMLKAAYRFFSHDAIAPPDFLSSHIESTYSRLDKVPWVLAVQDTTEVNWTGHRATKGLGPLGHTACQGLHVHSPLAFTPERVPLGLLAQHVWARDPLRRWEAQAAQAVARAPEGQPERAHQSGGGWQGTGLVCTNALCQRGRP